MDPITPTPETEEPKGKVLASFQVRVTLRQSSDPALAEPTPGQIPTNNLLADIIGEALYRDTAFHRDEIHVTSERTDI
jgi:hypothetical protein